MFQYYNRNVIFVKKHVFANDVNCYYIVPLKLTVLYVKYISIKLRKKQVKNPINFQTQTKMINKNNAMSRPEPNIEMQISDIVRSSDTLLIVDILHYFNFNILH